MSQILHRYAIIDNEGFGMNKKILRIESPQNEQIKSVVKLTNQSKMRKEQGKIVLEGVHLLQSLLEQKLDVDAVFVHEDKVDQTEIHALLVKIDEEKQYVVAARAFEKLSALTHGADLVSVAHMSIVKKIKEISYDTSCVVLENIQDPGNLGTILRSCAASGIKQVVLSEGCVDVFSPKVLRSGMGAHFLLNIVAGVDVVSFIKKYQGMSLATALNEQTYSLYEQDLTGTVAFIFGSEGAGVSETLQKSAKKCIKIPMLGQTESLNVAMAATICLFERVRQLDFKS